MAHFARVNNGTVEEVIVAEQDFIDNYDCPNPGTWIQTSYNTLGGVHRLGGTPLRYNYAGIGYVYDAVADAFSEPKPFNSWTLNTKTYLWEAPVTYPTDGKEYTWNEDTTSWDLIE